MPIKYILDERCRSCPRARNERCHRPEQTGYHRCPCRHSHPAGCECRADERGRSIFLPFFEKVIKKLLTFCYRTKHQSTFFLCPFYRAFILCIMIIRKMVVVLFMGTNYFTDEQLRLLEENPYVVKASKKV